MQSGVEHRFMNHPVNAPQTVWFTGARSLLYFHGIPHWLSECFLDSRSRSKFKQQGKKETAMKKNLTRSMIVTAAFAFSAAAVFAQTKLTANVPFAFSTMGTHWSSGRYEIVSAMSSNAGVLWIRNVATGAETNLGIGNAAVPESTNAPRLVFKCADEKCALAEVWRDDGRGYKFPTPRLKPSQIEHVAVIHLDRKNGD
jgi:hypothetical protein